MSIVPSCVTASTSESLVTSSCIGVTCSANSRLNASRGSSFLVPANTSPAPASTNAPTSVRPRPRPAPEISIRLPSICMCVRFGHRPAPLYPRELIKHEPDDSPNEHQFDTRQRVFVQSLAKTRRAQNFNVLTQLNQNHHPHGNNRYDGRDLQHTPRQADLDLARQRRVPAGEEQKYQAMNEIKHDQRKHCNIERE